MLMAGAEVKDVAVDIPTGLTSLDTTRLEPSEEAKQTFVVKIRGN